MTPCGRASRPPPGAGGDRHHDNERECAHQRDGGRTERLAQDGRLPARPCGQGSARGGEHGATPSRVHSRRQETRTVAGVVPPEGQEEYLTRPRHGSESGDDRAQAGVGGTEHSASASPRGVPARPRAGADLRHARKGARRALREQGFSSGGDVGAEQDRHDRDRHCRAARRSATITGTAAKNTYGFGCTARDEAAIGRPAPVQIEEPAQSFWSARAKTPTWNDAYQLMNIRPIRQHADSAALPRLGMGRASPVFQARSQSGPTCSGACFGRPVGRLRGRVGSRGLGRA